MNRKALCCLAVLSALCGWLMLAESTPAYIGGPPLSLGIMCNWSTHVMIAKVDKIDRDKNVVIFQKVRDVKGKWPSDVVRQFFNPGLPTRGHVMNWAEPGKTVMFYALESYKWSHTYIDGEWYASNTADWNNWTVSHSEPLLLRMYAGRPNRLADASEQILLGKEVVVPGMVDGPMDDLIKKKAGYQRLKASLKLLDYNPKRDLVGPGKDDFEPVVGMAGFAQMARLVKMGRDAQAITCADFTGTGTADLCLVGVDKVTVMLNGGDYMHEIPVPGLLQGCRAAVAADYNGDGKADLLLATATGPRLYTNVGHGHFRDDTAVLPTESTYTLTAAAWIDYDGDGYPDVLLANGYHGLRLYRNKGKPAPTNPAPLVKGKLPLPSRSFDDWSDAVGLGSHGNGANLKGYSLSVCDVNGDGRPDFLYGAGGGLLFMNTLGRFVIKDSGISVKDEGGRMKDEKTPTDSTFNLQPSSLVFGDFNGDGVPDLFTAQYGQCQLFQGVGQGRFRDVTAKTGDLTRAIPWATSAAWGDVDNDGHLDLVIGCLKGPNRYLRNRGDGTFEDCTEKIGLDRKHFNTQAVSLLDLNGDGLLDMIFNNEGQEAVALLRKTDEATKRTPVTVFIAGNEGIIGSRVYIFGKAELPLRTHEVCGGSGRHQPPPQAHFALEPGEYRIEVRSSSGLVAARDIAVGSTSLRTRIEMTSK